MAKVAAELDADHEGSDGGRGVNAPCTRGEQKDRRDAFDEKHAQKRELKEGEGHAAREPSKGRGERLRDEEVLDVARVVEGGAKELLLAKPEH